MPNHVHGIICIDNFVFVGEGFKPSPTVKIHGLTEMIRGFKTFSSKRTNEFLDEKIFSWQRSFHDRVIRNETEWENIRHYIKTSPENWESDDLFLDL